MKRIIVAIQAGALLLGLAACDQKKNYEANEKDAVAHITVTDEQGKPQAGATVLIFDEKGYERFSKDRKSEPQGFTLTLPNGKVSYRLPYTEWFKYGNRQVTFVVMEMLDEDNYHIWTVSRTVKAAEQVKVEFILDRTPAGPGNTGEKDGNGESGKEGEQMGKPVTPADPAGSVFELFDPQHGNTLFAGGVALDAEHYLDGSNRYTIADAGMVESLDKLTDLSLDRAAHRISAWPGHGYFVCKDIALMEFPSGKRALAVGSDYARVHAAEWIARDGKNIGLKINYSFDKLPGDGLPEWGKVYEVKLTNDRSVAIPLPTDKADSECAPWGKTPLRFSFAQDHVTAQIMDPQAAPGKEYRFVIRSGARYTEAKLRITE